LENLDKFFRNKENEFEEIVEQKDRKLRELEKSINMISEEAQTQIYKLTQSASDFNEKINSYQIRENQLSNDNAFLENQVKTLSDKITNYEKIINKLERQNETFSTQSINKSTLSIPDYNPSEKLKSKLKEKDVYISNLERDIDVLYT
jgi:chromosome segregation ATPase